MILSKTGTAPSWDDDEAIQQLIFDSIAAGAMAQSVGLVAAAEGLGTCIRGSIDHEAFAKAARLLEGERIIAAQTIGVLL